MLTISRTPSGWAVFSLSGASSFPLFTAMELTLLFTRGAIKDLATLQNVIRDLRENLTQGQEQCLGAGHMEDAGVPGKQLCFEHAGLVRTHGLTKRRRDGALQAVVILHGDEVRMIFTQPGQHPRVHV